MAVTQVTGQEASAQFTSTTGGATFPGNTTNANLVHVSVTIGGSATVSSVTDSQGNTYERLRQSTATGAGRSVEMWRAKNITGGTTPTVTVNLSASVIFRLSVYEIQGADTTSPDDVGDTNGSDSGVTAMKASNAGVTSQTGVFGFVCGVTDTGGQTFTPGGSWSQSPTIGARFYFAKQEVSGSLSGDTGAFTASASSLYRACMQVYKPAAGGGPPTRSQLIHSKLVEGRLVA